MKGTVIGFDHARNSGAIDGDKGRRYEFAAIDWCSGGRVRHGQRVDFNPVGNRATQIFLITPEYVAPNLWQFYLSPRGRISRSQYWLRFFVPVLAIAIVLDLLAVFAGGAARVLPELLQLVALWPGITVLIKRIHDRNKPGSLVWALYGPLILALFFIVETGIAVGSHAKGAIMGFGMAAGWLSLICAGVGIWFLIEFGCLRGTVGPNAYGPDPVRDR